MKVNANSCISWSLYNKKSIKKGPKVVVANVSHCGAKTLVTEIMNKICKQLQKVFLYILFSATSSYRFENYMMHHLQFTHTHTVLVGSSHCIVSKYMSEPTLEPWHLFRTPINHHLQSTRLYLPLCRCWCTPCWTHMHRSLFHLSSVNIYAIHTTCFQLIDWLRSLYHNTHIWYARTWEIVWDNKMLYVLYTHSYTSTPKVVGSSFLLYILKQPYRHRIVTKNYVSMRQFYLLITKVCFGKYTPPTRISITQSTIYIINFEYGIT